MAYMDKNIPERPVPHPNSRTDVDVYGTWIAFNNINFIISKEEFHVKEPKSASAKDVSLMAISKIRDCERI